ncbi:hypothetical protein AB0D98_18445 [Streptomyces sp. NPDC047987]|uniref:hypothetical protein n=1 Tax=unclassified Streptomyces TaxID=2593676 RepID=UPI0034171D74
MSPFPGHPAVTDHEGRTVPADGTGRDTMDSYEVTFFRTEMITFTLSADSAQDAAERYLMDGEETGSDTVRLSVDSIKRLEEPTPPA